jgi:hypothetical protein
MRFLGHTQRRTTVGRTPPDEWSARRRDLYLTTHNIHNRQTSTSPVRFEPMISAGERPETYALYRVATTTGYSILEAGKSFSSFGVSSFPGGVAEGSIILRHDSESMPNRVATFHSYLQDISTLEGDGSASPLLVLIVSKNWHIHTELDFPLRFAL